MTEKTFAISKLSARYVPYLDLPEAKLFKGTFEGFSYGACDGNILLVAPGNVLAELTEAAKTDDTIQPLIERIAEIATNDPDVFISFDA